MEINYSIKYGEEVGGRAYYYVPGYASFGYEDPVESEARLKKKGRA